MFRKMEQRITTRENKLKMTRMKGLRTWIRTKIPNKLLGMKTSKKIQSCTTSPIKNTQNRSRQLLPRQRKRKLLSRKNKMMPLSMSP